MSLPEVLGLLASARKSGALWLEAGPISGTVHLEDGHCLAAEHGDTRGPVESGGALLARLVDVCFEVTRQEIGGFRFAAEEAAPWSCAEPVELSDALVELDRMMKQWREILRVIPSLDCRPRLLESLEVDEIVVDRDRWALLVAIDGRRTVGELVQRAARPMIEVCHSLLEMVEAGAVGVIDPAAAVTLPPVAEAPIVETPIPEAPTVEPRSVEVPVGPAELAEAAVVTASPVETAPVETVPVETVPVPVMAMANANGGESVEPGVDPTPVADEGGDAPDKGAFLRLFSGLRES